MKPAWNSLKRTPLKRSPMKHWILLVICFHLIGCNGNENDKDRAIRLEAELNAMKECSKVNLSVYIEKSGELAVLKSRLNKSN